MEILLLIDERGGKEYVLYSYGFLLHYKKKEVIRSCFSREAKRITCVFSIHWVASGFIGSPTHAIKLG